MALNYAMYDLRTGARKYPGSPTGSGGSSTTYGSPIFTAEEFYALLAHIKKMGFHVYANTAYGGVNFSAHSPLSWHYVKDAYGRSLAADIGTYGDINERSRIINELIPLLDRYGVAWHYARDGYVPAHQDHIHIDVSNWGRRGGPAPNYGYFNTYKKRSPLDLAGSTASKRRNPKRIAINYGSKDARGVRLVQRIVGVKRDGSFGPATENAVKKLQRSLGVTPDGSFGPATARAYLAKYGAKGPGAKGRAVRLIQYIAGVTIDGHYGPATTKAVKELQRTAGLTADGWFGPASRNKLVR